MAGGGGFEAVDARLTRWMSRRGVALLRWSLGVVFLWFGALKFFPGASPAEDLAARTIAAMTSQVSTRMTALERLPKGRNWSTTGTATRSGSRCSRIRGSRR